MMVFPFFKNDWSFLLFIGQIPYLPSVRFFIGPENIPAKLDNKLFKPFILIITILNLSTVFLFLIVTPLYETVFPFVLFTNAVLGLVLVFNLYKINNRGVKLVLTGILFMIGSGILRLIMDQYGFLPHFYLYSLGIIIEALFFLLAYNHRKSQHEIGLALVKNELNFKQREIMQKTMHITQQSQILENIRGKLEGIDNNSTNSKQFISNLISEIALNINQNSWDEFERYFIKVHPVFFTRLKQQCPTLTSNELRLCAMLRLALSTKEIAAISGKTPKSIDVMRTRIRNKMELTRNEKLYDVLTVIN
jgi:DNA-binding CsgD family transcriptional regulator